MTIHDHTGTDSSEPAQTAAAHLRSLLSELEHSVEVTLRELDRIADTIDPGESNDVPAKSSAESFDDNHYFTLAGIIAVSRSLFREINEPSATDHKQALEDKSCALIALADDLEVALGRRGMRASKGGAACEKASAAPELTKLDLLHQASVLIADLEDRVAADQISGS